MATSDDLALLARRARERVEEMYRLTHRAQNTADATLVALAEEVGDVEAARMVGCPQSWPEAARCRQRQQKLSRVRL
jgi:hypothetical protein